MHTWLMTLFVYNAPSSVAHANLRLSVKLARSDVTIIIIQCLN